MQSKKCLHCTAEFRVSNYRKYSAKFCSPACYSEYRHKQNPSFVCEQCGVTFIVHKSTARYNANRFCSVACSTKYRRSIPITDRRWWPARYGYMRTSVINHGHPMADKSGCLLQHWYVYYEAAEDKEKVLELRRMRCTLHHKNGNRADNRIENLELRMPGMHPTGVSTQDAIHFLSLQGYSVTIETQIQNEILEVLEKE